MDKAEILEEIKKSRKYAGLSEEVIEREIEKFVKKYPAWKEHKLNFVAKQVKAELHKAYGSFQTYKKGKREKLLEKLRKNPKNIEIIREILKTNLSTKERLSSYGLVYEKIFEITGMPNSILDVGCGLNPLSFPYMELDKDIRYYACDISKEDIALINEFFELYKINGRADISDLKNLKETRKLDAADVCLMFKVLDPLEKADKGHKIAENIIEILAEKCKFIVTSFATSTLSGKKMRHAYRGWIERMLERTGFKYSKFDTSNEVYYIISSN